MMLKTSIFMWARSKKQRTRRTLAFVLLASLAAPVDVFAAGALPTETQLQRHFLKLSGISLEQGRKLQQSFPHIFTRKVSLAEVDEVVRWVQGMGSFSNVEVLKRQTTEGPELVLVATSIRKIGQTRITGNSAIADSEVRALLGLEPGKRFERKELIENVSVLQGEYRKRGYRSMNAEIDFETPNENEVNVNVKVDEGEPTLIGEILIETSNTKLAAIIEPLRKRLLNRILDEEMVEEFGRQIAEKLIENRFLTARVSDPQLSLSDSTAAAKLFISIENPWRYQFEFAGNREIPLSSLYRSLRLDQLVGSVTSPAPELAERVKRYYQELGYAHIELNVTEKASETGNLRTILFSIDEGPRVRLHQVEVTGNISRSGSYYAQFLKSSNSDVFGVGFFNRKDIEESVKTIETALQDQGYLRAKVKSWRTEFFEPKGKLTARQRENGKGSKAKVFLSIDEGPLTLVRQIRFEGAESFGRTQLQNLLPLQAGEPFRVERVTEAIDALKAFYQSKGFVEMKVLNETEGLVTYNPSSTQATLEFQISEGPRVTVAGISIEGNQMTQSDVILREIPLETGVVYTPELREESIFRLQRLGLFSKVSIRTLEEDTSIAERNVVIEVDEAVPGTVETGIGIAQDLFLLARGYVGASYRNLFGTGRAISARFDPFYTFNENIDYLEHRITASYLEPYIFRDRNKGRVNLVREIRFFEFDSQNRTILQEVNSLSALLERDLTRNSKLTFTLYNLANFNQFDRRSFNSVLTQTIAKTGPLFEIDFRDNVFYPTQGSYTTLGIEYSDPNLGSSRDESLEINFVKLSASFSYPHRIFGSPFWIFANAVRVGYLSNLSDSPVGGVPAQEAFFLGGRSTIRGFQQTGTAVDVERIPNLIQLGEENLRNFFVRSDSYYYLIKSELRFPISRSLSFGEVYGALFYDGGAVHLSQLRLTDAYRDSFGPALRIIFAGGIALSLEYGHKLNRRSWDGRQEEPGAFHLSIGTF